MRNPTILFIEDPHDQTMEEGNQVHFEDSIDPFVDYASTIYSLTIKTN